MGEWRVDQSALAPFYSAIGRPSVDPQLLIRMLLLGYCFGIRPERRLCEEVSLNLAYRWFCRLGLEGDVPDHSTLSKNRYGRFRDSDLLRELFETVLRRCMAEGLVGSEGFAVDASLIKAEVEMQFAHLKVFSSWIDCACEALTRQRRVPSRRHRPEPAQNGQADPATDVSGGLRRERNATSATGGDPPATLSNEIGASPT